MRDDPAYRAGQVIVVFVLYGKFAFRQAIPPVMHERDERRIPIKCSCRTSILSHHRTVVLGRGKVPGMSLVMSLLSSLKPTCYIALNVEVHLIEKI
jgi:hypothetical protein